MKMAKGYRQLGTDEVLRKDDEFYDVIDKTWRKTRNMSMRVGAINIYRRRVKS